MNTSAFWSYYLLLYPSLSIFFKHQSFIWLYLKCTILEKVSYGKKTNLISGTRNKFAAEGLSWCFSILGQGRSNGDMAERELSEGDMGTWSACVLQRKGRDDYRHLLAFSLPVLFYLPYCQSTRMCSIRASRRFRYSQLSRAVLLNQVKLLLRIKSIN